MNGSKAALVVAAVLGVAGAGLNLWYLNEKSKAVAMTPFIGIKPNTVIRPGDKFLEDNFVRIDIPENHVGALKAFAVGYEDRNTVVGMPAVKSYTGGELLLRDDLRTPPPAMDLGQDERALPIPVDTRNFVPSLVNPGDLISFMVGGAPTPAAPPQDPENTEEPPVAQPVPTGRLPGMKAEAIGPFRVLSIGNRLGSAEVMKASGQPQYQENVILIAVKMQGDQLEPKAAKLLAQLQLSGTRQAGVLLHPRTSK
jgi:hypothetical protein